MERFERIAEDIRSALEVRNQERDWALAQARVLTRTSATTTRAVHRGEVDVARAMLDEAHGLVLNLQERLAALPDLYYAGYVQDAVKEYVEATLTFCVIGNLDLPSPRELNVPEITYLNGMAEVSGELRRRILDILRQGYSPEAERLLTVMDDIYGLLITLDYPDALTNGLRRQTDMVRGILERTRADLTLSVREQRLQDALGSRDERP